MIAQILSVVIFLLMFILIILDKIERHFVTLLCAAATIIIVFGFAMHSMDATIQTLNIRSIFTIDFWYSAGNAAESSSGINWSTIIFIFGMMVMVEGMAKAGFFRWLCLTIAKAVKYRIVPIFITFMLMSTVLAMFIDSITVILFLAAVTVELSKLLKFNPLPMILAEIFCANLGGSATMCGDPPNIIIGTSLGYSFMDFLTNTGFIVIFAFIATVIYFYFVFKKQLKSNNNKEQIHYPDPGEAIKSKGAFAVSTVIFLCAIVLLITHAQTGLTVAFIGIFIAGATLITSGKSCIKLLKLIDYKTLLFFIGLFVVVGSLEQTGVLNLIASLIETISGGNAIIMAMIIMWVSAVASAFVDNIPFAATMIPVIKSLSAASGAALPVLAWSLAIGTDIGGSATPIGASANVVGTSVAAKNGHPVSWGHYCRSAVPATVIVLVIASVCIILRYF